MFKQAHKLVQFFLPFKKRVAVWKGTADKLLNTIESFHRMQKTLAVFFWTSILTTVLQFYCVQCRTEDNKTLFGNPRQEKVFSLFSIVSFKNVGCKSQSAASTGQSSSRNGTCFTSSECSSKGGTASGNCAAGFGVCCIFLITSGTVNQNCTYIRNPGFPSVYTTTSTQTYNIVKCSTDICFIRLDFEIFSIIGPLVETEADGGACSIDSMKTTVTNGLTIPTICGLNTGQHLYINLGDKPTETAMITFTFTGSSTTRNWELKVTQIECSNLNRPPVGCQQYYTTTSGRITTFNFLNTALQHLANQDVSACIRRPAGYCCVSYRICPDFDGDGFTIDSNLGPNLNGAAMVDNLCVKDYVGIPESGGSCSIVGSLNSKYCGVFLNPFASTTTNAQICSCVPPFLVHFHTDGIADATALPIGPARGVCLDYNLIPCTP